MSVIHERMADALRAANDHGGLSLGELAEECANVGERIALGWWEQRLSEMRLHGYVVAEDRGVLYLVAAERDSSAAAAADPAASAGLGGPAVSLSGPDRLFGHETPSAYREAA